MTEQTDLFDRLKDLRALSTKKNHKLAKPEQKEACSILLALGCADENGYQSMIAALPDFQSDVGAEVLADSWSNLIDAKRPVLRDLNTVKFNTDLGKRLRLILAQKLMATSPAQSLRVLLDVCQTIQPDQKRFPPAKDLGLIRVAFIATAWESLELLPMQEAMASENALVSTCLLAAAFMQKTSKKPLLPGMQLAAIRWANKDTRLVNIPTELVSAIVEVVKEWDKESLALLSNVIDTLQPVFREILAPFCGTDNPATLPPLPPAQSAVPTKTPALPSLEPSSNTSERYDVVYEIARIGKYVQSLENQLRKGRESLQSAEEDWHRTLDELGAARRERDEARRLSAVAHDSTERLANEKVNLQKETEFLRSELGKQKAQLEIATDRHKEAIAAYEKELDMLSERIAHEGDRRVDAFRNKLGARVQTYADGLADATGRDMTPELGGAMRGQLRQVLRYLKLEGVPVEGEL